MVARAALAAMDAAHAAGRLPILCGGTGLYFAALTHGLADIPEPARPPAPRPAPCWPNTGRTACTPRWPHVDPATAARLQPSDGQRIARAWEVWRGTGRGLAAWQAERRARRRGASPHCCSTRRARRCAPPSPLGSTPCWRQGALAEVAALLALDLDPALPAMRAHGVPELAAHLRGELTLAEAERRAVLATGQYTKRQATWFRHRTWLSRHERIRSMRELRVYSNFGK